MNILDLTQALNPLNGSLYIVIGGSDYYIETDDLLNLQTNQSIRFNSQSITAVATAQTINFSDRSGQVAFADANYMIIPYAYDSDGVLTPVKVPDSGKSASGFTVTNESGVALTFNYIALKL